MSAGYSMMGIEFENGELKLRSDAFEQKGDLRLESIEYRGKKYNS